MFCLIDEGRHLEQPGGRLPAQEREERRSLRPGYKASKGLEHREVGLPGAVLFQTLPTPDPKALGVRDVRQEGFYQGGLADPRLPGHEHHLAPPAERRLKRALKHG